MDSGRYGQVDGKVIKVYKQCKYLGVTTYKELGSTQKDRQELEPIEMGYLRSCGVLRLERVTNEEITMRIQIEKRTMEEMEDSRLKWYGHVKEIDGPRKY